MSGKFKCDFYFLHTSCMYGKIIYAKKMNLATIQLAADHALQPNPHFATIFTFWELGNNKKIEEENLLRKWQTVPSWEIESLKYVFYCPQYSHSLISPDWIDKVGPSSPEVSWKSQSVTGPRIIFINISWRMGMYHQMASNHIWDQKGFGEPGLTYRISGGLVTQACSGHFTCLRF